jgi:hypothetical protein
VGTVPTPSTAVAGVAATAAQGNSWRDSNNWCLSNHPICVLRNSAVQSIANATSTAITFDIEDIDSDAGHSLVTNTSRYTAQTAGWYLITVYGSFAVSANALACQIEIRVNSAGITLATSQHISSATGNVATHLSTSTHYFLNGTTDFVEMYMFQNTTAALNAGAQGRMTVEWRRNL